MSATKFRSIGKCCASCHILCIIVAMFQIVIICPRPLFCRRNHCIVNVTHLLSALMCTLISEIGFSQQNVFDHVSKQGGCVCYISPLILAPRVAFSKACKARVNSRLCPCAIGVTECSNRESLCFNLTLNRNASIQIVTVVSIHYDRLTIVLQKYICIIFETQPAIELQHTFGTNVIFVETLVAHLIYTIVAVVATADIESSTVRTATDRNIMLCSKIVIAINSAQPVGITKIFIVTSAIGALLFKQWVCVTTL